MKWYGICILYVIFLFNCGEAQDLVNAPQVTSDKITYSLFTSDSPQTLTVLNDSNANILSTSAPIVFLIHGHSASRTTEWYELAKNAFFGLNSQYQVIEVDWSFYASLNYVDAQKTVKGIGFLIGGFLVTLFQQHSIPVANVLVVGHSLGAHMGGFMGQKTIESNITLKRIIGLDPGGPLYPVVGQESERLSPEDAEVVHVIHCSGGTYGYLPKCGTIDFYPNGGSLQPGCPAEIVGNLLTANFKLACSHERCWKYFIEGIQAPTTAFLSRKCNSYSTYKLAVNSCPNETELMSSLVTTKTGRFYLDTNSDSTYSKS